MFKINRNEISQKIDKGEPIVLTFKFINEKLLMILNGILAKLLAKSDHMFLLNSLIMILREVIVNALKANVKRVFFKKLNLDITDSDDYTEGMMKFRNQIIGDFNVIEFDVMKSEYYINIKFELSDGDLMIQIENNATMLKDEVDRIIYRIEKAIKYNDFTEAYVEIEDSKEGAGLGIVLAILLLKNMGINPGNFTIKSKDDVTITKLIIPYQLRPKNIISKVREKILNEIEGIPTFPRHILHLQNLCNDPDSSIELISKNIMTDPALSADVIKLSNSAGFFPGKRIENINTAVMTIGLKNVNAILIASNARRILNKRYNKFEQIWDHCNKTALYARNIALIYSIPKIIENVFMAGLLHDLGKIILLTVNMTTLETIANLVQNRKIVTSTIMEEISIGMSHSSIGELIAMRWNFPEYLVEAIKNHHSPSNTDEEHKNIVETVYLANMFCGIEDRKYSYYYFEENLLEKYDILDENKFSNLHDKLKKQFELLKSERM